MDYYVEGSMPIATDRDGWLVARGHEREKLGFFRSVDQALALARSLAANKSREGTPSQVHFRLNARIPWRTIWHEACDAPRHRHLDLERLQALLGTAQPAATT